MMRATTLRTAVVLVLVLLLGAPGAALAAPPDRAAPVVPSAAGDASRQPAPTYTVIEGGTLTIDLRQYISDTWGGLAEETAWQRSTDGGSTWAFVDGQTTERMLTVPGVTLAMDGYQYRLRVRVFFNVIDLDPSVLRVAPAVPTVTGHPTDRTVDVGVPVTFSASYGGTASAVSTQWQVSTDQGTTWGDVPGGTATTLSLGAAAASMDGARYRARFSNASGSVLTNAARLTVRSALTAPVVTTHPRDVTIPMGQSASFTVAATGSDVSVQWQRSSSPTAAWSDVSASAGGRAWTLSVSVGQSTAVHGYRYRAVVSNAAGSVTSEPATLSIIGAVRITEHPADVTVAPGATATLRAAATVSSGVEGDLAVRWQQSDDRGATWSDAPGASARQWAYTTPALSAAESGRRYRALVSNQTSTAGVASDPATVTVLTAPVITEHPQDVTIPLRETASFTVAATGSDLSVQWQQAPGPTAAWSDVSAGVGGRSWTLSISAGQNAATLNGYRYRAVVSNAAGSVTSEPATLSIIGTARFTQHPADLTVAEGATATFRAATAMESGVEGNLAVRWQQSDDRGATWSDAPGTAAREAGEWTFTTPVLSTAEDGRRYRALAWNQSSTAFVVSDPAIVRVLTPPVIATHPQDVTMPMAGSASFTVVATGSDLSVQWQRAPGPTAGWVDVSASTGGADWTLSVSAAQSTVLNGYRYRAVVSNAVGSVTSEPATLSVVGAVRITDHPADVTVAQGATATLRAAATVSSGAEGDLAVQWQQSDDRGATWSDAPGASARQWAYTTPALSAAESGRRYRALVSNQTSTAGVASDPATVTVQTAPLITEHPQDVTVAVGSGAVAFRYAAVGEGLSVRWETSSDGGGSWTLVTTGSSTSGGYSVQATAANDGRLFRVVVSNAAGTVTSEVGRLTVVGRVVITEDPVDVSVVEGAAARFRVAASVSSASEGGLAVRWQQSDDGVSWVDAPGESAGSWEYVVPVARWADGGRRFRAVVSNEASPAGVVSGTARLTVSAALPVVTVHPADRSVTEGESVSFTGAYGGTEAPTSVRWQYSPDGGVTWLPVSDGGEAPLVVDPTYREMDGWWYRVQFANEAGSVWSDAARLTVEERSAPAPVVTEHPQDVTVAVGSGSVVFRYAAVGEDLSAQWEVSVDGGASWQTRGSASSLASGSYSVASSAANDGLRVRVVVSNAAGTVTSEVGRLTVVGRVVITEDPVDVSVVEGAAARFRVAASVSSASEGGLAVRWQQSDDGVSWVDAPGESAGSWEYVVPVARWADGGRRFRAVVSNEASPAGVVSGTARLTVVRLPSVHVRVTPRVVLVDALPGRDAW
ncbi:hypothetical protein [Cellulosimicrobium cellulans]|uniref:hypothetical protein n=1 Tax=Cellulosimicrobium cellulans TaxID=1710 RepID=UPI00130E0425|nr:hypothetical protein [Cellulosimicrobium cellulans]